MYKTIYINHRQNPSANMSDEQKVAVKARWFLYTVHKYGEDWRQWMASFYEDRKPDYMVGQLEMGVETQKEHIQLAVHWKNPRSIKAVIDNIKDCGHVERCFNPKASLAYVQKDDTRVDGPVEYGEKPLDPPAAMEDFKQRVIAGESWQSLLMHPVHRMRYTTWAKETYKAYHVRHIANLRPMSEFIRPRMDFSDNRPVLLIGPTAYGKTSWALAHFDRPFFVGQMDHFQSFNPSMYDGIVVDDLKIDWTREQWNNATGEHFRSVHCRFFNADEIPVTTPMIFTSNYMPVIVEKDSAVARRLHIINITEPTFRHQP